MPEGTTTHFASEFIREHRGEILAEWERTVRTMPLTRQLDRPSLINHIPGVLDRIAQLGDELEAGSEIPRIDPISENHGLQRLSAGFDPTQLVVELGILRDCIMRLWEERVADPARSPELRRLNLAIDSTVASSIGAYVTARDRTLHAFDLIAKAALESRSLDELLQRLLHVLIETNPLIHLATILVRDGSVLRVRASVGLEDDDELVRTFTQEIGEGFAGTIASTRKPLALASAATDPIVKRLALRNSGVRALYGIPLIQDGEVIAVAHMGSRTADRFSEEDIRLFEATADRAAVAIYQQLLREIAERTATELRARELELRSLADNIPQLSWMADGPGKVYWCNKRWLDYTGMSLEDMPSATAQLVRPDHVGHVMASNRQAILTGTSWEDTFPLRGRNGRYRWFLARAIPIRDEHAVIVHWFGTMTDVTEQRFLDEATKLLNSSLNYHETLEQLAHLAVPDLADWCVVDLVEESGEIRRVAVTHADPAKLAAAREWDRRFRPHWSPDSGVGKVIRTGEPEFASEVTDAKLVSIADSEEHLAALKGVGMSSYITTALVARGRTFGAITLLAAESQRHYTTADVEVAQELGRRAGIAVDNARLYQESQRALRDREEAVRSRDEVLAIVSHDLRNPLGAIGLSTSSLLHDPTNTACPKKPLQVIQRSAGRMEHMINELLDMATIQARGLALNLTPEEPGPLLMSIVEAHEAMATERGIKLVAECDLPPLRMMADRDRVEQVFANLIGNAIKYCRPGDTVYVRGCVADGQPLFSIADTGPGIAPVDLPHLFEPYWAVKHHDTKKGTGLGLYICKGIVEAHGGKLWVESKLGEGTTFYFTLQPAAKAA